MFNEEVKVKYLKTLNQNTAIVVESTFKKVETAEEKLKKDIALFDEQEFGEMLRKMGFTSQRTLNNFKSTLNTYISWYQKENKVKITKIKGNYSVKLNYYKSISELLADIRYVIADKVDKLEYGDNLIAFHRKDLEAKYNTGKAVLIFSWYGIPKEEMVTLKVADVSEETCQIYLEGKNKYIPCDKDAMQILSQIKNTKRYVNISKDITGSSYMTDVFLKNTGYFFKKSESRTRGSDTISVTNIGKAISEINNNDLGKTFSPLKLRENGMFVKAFEKEKTADFKIIYQTDEDYLNLFDNAEWVKELSPPFFSALKQKYIKFTEMMKK